MKAYKAARKTTEKGPQTTVAGMTIVQEMRLDRERAVQQSPEQQAQAYAYLLRRLAHSPQKLELVIQALGLEHLHRNLPA